MARHHQQFDVAHLCHAVEPCTKLRASVVDEEARHRAQGCRLPPLLRHPGSLEWRVTPTCAPRRAPCSILTMATSARKHGSVTWMTSQAHVWPLRRSGRGRRLYVRIVPSTGARLIWSHVRPAQDRWGEVCSAAGCVGEIQLDSSQPNACNSLCVFRKPAHAAARRLARAPAYSGGP